MNLPFFTKHHIMLNDYKIVTAPSNNKIYNHVQHTISARCLALLLSKQINNKIKTKPNVIEVSIGKWSASVFLSTITNICVWWRSTEDQQWSFRGRWPNDLASGRQYGSCFGRWNRCNNRSKFALNHSWFIIIDKETFLGTNVRENYS